MGETYLLLHDEGEGEELAAFLVARVYEFNTKATGYVDGRLMAGSVRDEHGEIIAAFNGHTWGGSCEIAHLSVHERCRGRGVGRTLLLAAEAEAMRRGAERVIISTYNFQAPGFYEQLGYERVASIMNHPKGYLSLVYIKQLSI